ncbi:LytR family transcriptional regulator [Herbidospora galbida]|uniref:LytR family transcriptional regulator n=1 Tax=Herbidospora galbida TaxID=2575442 RepID=A0A4U3MGJ6_9ACTN|nr:LCP family protein [Herbidospora galbida]TKK87709.1 LytR family transcriptional regulator [Herbidospora galbida]
MRENRSLRRALALTLASTLLWGVAHIWTGRTRTGLTLAAVWLTLLSAGVTVLGNAPTLPLRRLDVVVAAGAALAVAWVAVIVWSWLVIRPRRVRFGLPLLAVAGLCVLVAAPLGYASRLAYVSNEVVSSVFVADDPAPQVVTPVVDPWAGRERLNVLLVGADSAENRPGARTDSMTVASVDTRTGESVLFSLPRNLQNVPVDGFPPAALLNEVFQWGEDHGRSGADLLKSTVGDILGLDVDYYAMVDMRGFAQIINAMGGVTVKVPHDIVFGAYREGLIKAGTHHLNGTQALWFGRSRTDSDDYQRMGRQKCLLNAVAEQADPLKVLRGFERIADVTKRYVSTDIPRSLVPDLIDLAPKVKGADIKSLQFVPPLIRTGDPDWELIQEKVDEALGERTRPIAATPAAKPKADKPVDLDESCA